MKAQNSSVFLSLGLLTASFANAAKPAADDQRSPLFYARGLLVSSLIRLDENAQQLGAAMKQSALIAVKCAASLEKSTSTRSSSRS